jgi:hypothetical protein
MKSGHPRGHASNINATKATDSVENYSLGTWKTGFLSMSNQNYAAHLALSTMVAKNQMEILNNGNFTVKATILTKDLDVDMDEFPKMQKWKNGKKIHEPYKIIKLILIMQHFYEKHNDKKHDVFILTFYPTP